MQATSSVKAKASKLKYLADLSWATFYESKLDFSPFKISGVGHALAILTIFDKANLKQIYLVGWQIGDSKDKRLFSFIKNKDMRGAKDT